jgi:hypothetical protein
MRSIVSFVGLLLVVAIIGLVAKKQLGSVAVLPPVANSAGAAMPVVTPGATVQQQSMQIQQQVKQSVDAAMQQARPVADDK